MSFRVRWDWHERMPKRVVGAEAIVMYDGVTGTEGRLRLAFGDAAAPAGPFPTVGANAIVGRLFGVRVEVRLGVGERDRRAELRELSFALVVHGGQGAVVGIW